MYYIQFYKIQYTFKCINNNNGITLIIKLKKNHKYM
jgi:hypothetical protein